MYLYQGQFTLRTIAFTKCMYVCDKCFVMSISILELVLNFTNIIYSRVSLQC